ncbi:HWE histidine kinase domain-containing protein [Roseococcus sp.]|uniref:HWE histidine kinase domain-containing protein n=1 Tax=Roseococcus sp. TaxID=2109646 RepID=UPI003BAAD515
MDTDSPQGGPPPFSTHDDIVRMIDQGICVVEVAFDAEGMARDYRFLEVNPAFVTQTGLTDAVGRSMRELKADHEQHWFDIYGKVAKTGEPTRFQAPAAALERWYDVFAFRVEAPAQHRVAIVFDDITERRQTEERLRVLASEMAHRAKNTLAVVSSLAQLSQAESVEAYRAELVSRLTALGNSQHLVEAAAGRGADLRRLIELDLAGFQLSGEARVTMSGPRVLIEPGAAQSFALGLHELATNSAKYGALSVAAGRVAIHWAWSDGRLAWRWEETGGPPVKAPTRLGLGVRLIEKIGHDEIDGGQAEFDWRPEGLVCEMLLPKRTVLPA